MIDVLDVDGHAVSLRRHVLAFFQGNRFLLPSLAPHVVSHVTPGDRVIDLYVDGCALGGRRGGAWRDRAAVEGDCTGCLPWRRTRKWTGGAVKAVHEGAETFVERQHNTPNVLIVDCGAPAVSPRKRSTAPSA